MLDLKKLLTKILTHIKSSSALATASGSPSSSLCRCVKVGDVVDISGFYRRTTDITTAEVLFTVPNGYRPSSTLSIPAYVTNGNNVSLAFYVNIYADGTILQRAGNTMREVFFSGSYRI